MNTYDRLGLPEELGILLASITVLLALGPFLPGADFGIVKVPERLQKLPKPFKWLIPVVGVLPWAAFFPVWPPPEASASAPPQVDRAAIGESLDSLIALATVSPPERAEELYGEAQALAGLGEHKEGELVTTCALAALHGGTGRVPAATTRSEFERCRALSIELGDTLRHARALVVWGTFEEANGDVAHALNLFQQAMDLGVLRGGDLAQAHVATSQAYANRSQRDPAITHLDLAVDAAIVGADSVMKARALAKRCQLDISTFQPSRRYCDEALATRSRTGEPIVTPDALQALYYITRDRGELEDARRVAELLLGHYTEAKSPLGQANALLDLAALDMLEESYGRARERFERADSLAGHLRQPQAMAHALEGLMRMDMTEGRPLEAIEKTREMIRLFQLGEHTIDEARAHYLLSLWAFGIDSVSMACEALERAGVLFGEAQDFADADSAAAIIQRRCP